MNKYVCVHIQRHSWRNMCTCIYIYTQKICAHTYLSAHLILIYLFVNSSACISLVVPRRVTPLPLQPRSSTATCNYECMHVCMYACTQLCNYVYCRYVFPADYFKPLPWEAMRWVSRGWLRFVWQLDTPMQLSVARKQQSLARRRTERNQNRYKATSLLPLVRVGPFGS